MKRSQIQLFSILLAVVMVAAPAFASSHREAPLIKEDPTADTTDVYAFRDSDSTVTLIVNVNPLAEPASGPNFHSFSDNALYEIHIDNDGDAMADITYRFDFSTEVQNASTFLYNTGPVTSLEDENLNVRQFYDVSRVMDGSGAGSAVATGLQVAPANIGPKSTPDYPALANQAIYTLDSGGQVFAGPRDDPFFVDLGAAFDLLTLRPLQNLHQVPPAAEAADAVDTLQGYNVHSIALRVPITSVTNDGEMATDPAADNAIIGVWATTSRPRLTIRSTGLRPTQNFSGFTQVSRLGNPLVNEVVIPLAFKDFFNGSQPSGDFDLFQSNEDFANRILDPELATLITALYGVETPEAPRNDLVEVFLTGVEGLNMPANVVPAEMLRLNLAIPQATSPNRMGVLAGDNAGFPNGRRLFDDVVDSALRVVAGVLVEGFNTEPNNQLTDGVDINDVPFLDTFPYLAIPHQGFESLPHPMTATSE
ncbi:MAG: DUF4331 domain-containing protein [Thermoanaerobaculia bacterium]|nr:DUF4331 domain-containing protein [Thermoanaerobaculia bacterium]